MLGPEWEMKIFSNPINNKDHPVIELKKENKKYEDFGL